MSKIIFKFEFHMIDIIFMPVATAVLFKSHILGRSLF